MTTPTPPPPADILHLWQAVEASPHDQGLRWVLSDLYRDHGLNDEADAVRATAGMWPGQFRGLETIWAWHAGPTEANDERWSNHVGELFSHLTGNKTEYTNFSDYPTFLSAMFDLVAAWVKVNRAAVCERCKDHGKPGTLIGDPECQTCGGHGRVADPGSKYSDGTMDCPDCDRVDCPDCKGTGKATTANEGATP